MRFVPSFSSCLECSIVSTCPPWRPVPNPPPDWVMLQYCASLAVQLPVKHSQGFPLKCFYGCESCRAAKWPGRQQSRWEKIVGTFLAAFSDSLIPNLRLWSESQSILKLTCKKHILLHQIHQNAGFACQNVWHAKPPTQRPPAWFVSTQLGSLATVGLTWICTVAKTILKVFNVNKLVRHFLHCDFFFFFLFPSETLRQP